MNERANGNSSTTGRLRLAHMGLDRGRRANAGLPISHLFRRERTPLGGFICRPVSVFCSSVRVFSPPLDRIRYRNQAGSAFSGRYS